MIVARWTGKARCRQRSRVVDRFMSRIALDTAIGGRAIRQVADEHGLSEAEIKRRLKEKA